jgi:hypothetical protein
MASGKTRLDPFIGSSSEENPGGRKAVSSSIITIPLSRRHVVEKAGTASAGKEQATGLSDLIFRANASD